MNKVFALDHSQLATPAQTEAVARELTKLGTIESNESFNRYCKEACRVWGEHFSEGIGRTTQRFDQLLQQVNLGGQGIIHTSWGGVVVERHDHPAVEKYLVVRKGRYLALETHEEKDEQLEVLEGAGLLLSQSRPEEPLTSQVISPGDRFHFRPGQIHCLIGVENLLVFERSTDPRGMDQDLVFIYTPDVAQ